jgi:hypothetical protein
MQKISPISKLVLTFLNIHHLGFLYSDAGRSFNVVLLAIQNEFIFFKQGKID